MRPFLLACLLAVAVSACVLGTKQDITPYPFATYGQTAQESGPATAQDSVHGVDKAYVSVEVVFHAIQAEKYPLTTEALKRALQTWAENLPVRLAVYVEDPRPQTVTPFPFPVRSPSFLNRMGIVQIIMDDLQSPSFSFPEGLLGLWDSEQGKILLDADFLEANPDVAYSVCLHELGHLFGVPHVVGMHQPAPTGFLVLPEGVEAESYVMFPGHVPGKGQDKLSDLEISIAQHHLMHRMTDTWAPLRKDSCTLTLEH